METLAFDILMRWKWVDTTNKYYDFNTTLTWSSMDTKSNLQCSKIKACIYYFLVLRLKFLAAARYSSSVNIWTFCVFKNFVSVVWYQFQHWNKIADRFDSMCNIFSFNIPMKICFIRVNYVDWRLRNRFLKIFKTHKWTIDGFHGELYSRGGWNLFYLKIFWSRWRNKIEDCYPMLFVCTHNVDLKPLTPQVEN